MKIQDSGNPIPIPIWISQFAQERGLDTVQLLRAKEQLLLALRNDQIEAARSALKLIDPKFSLSLSSMTTQEVGHQAPELPWELDYDELSKRHVAEWLLAEGQENNLISLGFAPRDYIRAIKELELELNVGLSGLRCRVGVTRGHLLEVAIAIPLDLALSVAQLELVGEQLVSRILGDCFCDDWLAHVDVIRSARAEGLLMLNDSLPSAETHPLEELSSLAHRGAELILQEVESQGSGEAGNQAGYTALDIAAGRNDVLQAERVYASTAHPEALKSVLEGLPFSSLRFRRDGALFFYLSFSHQGTAEERLEQLQKVEDALIVSFQQELEISGRGFSPNLQYLDFFLKEAQRNLPGFLQRLQSLAFELKISGFAVGHYDSSYRSASYHIFA